jgi:hypothetical protein
MESNPLKPPPPPPLAVWWLIWGAITAAFFMVLGIFENGGVRIEAPPALSLIALAPFAGSAAARFLLVPRAPAAKKFIFFIIGLALAESGGFLALILSSPWKTPLAATAIVLMILHIPAFIRKS